VGFLSAVLDVVTPAIVFTSMTAVGLDLTRADFARLWRVPRVVAVGLFAPLVALPAIALALVRWFEPDPAVAAGLLLVASCPIGGISNAYSYLARASTALSVVLTGLSSVIALIAIPVTTRAFERILGEPLSVDAPVAILVLQLLLIVVLPISIGMLVRGGSPQWAKASRHWVHRLSFVLLGALLALVLTVEAERVGSMLSQLVLLAAVFVTASFAVGWLVGSAVRATSPDRFTLAAEFATRNVAIATSIAVTLLGRTEFAVFASVYFLTELPLMLAAVAVWRWRQAPTGRAA
jgi:BASS family bile acid:Na+ symporter